MARQVRRVLGVLAVLACAFAGTRPDPIRLWADPATNLLGTPSADGRYLSYADTATGDLALRSLYDGRSRSLTAADRAPGQFAYFSAISPDGQRVAYAWFNDRKFYELRLANVNGGPSRVVFRNEEAGFVQPCDWTPDGRYILTLLFRKDHISQITMISAEDGSMRVLRSLPWVYPKRMDLSPDGRYIVYDSFASDGDPQRDVFLLAADGSRETRLIPGPTNDLFPLWAPDGSHILFASDRSGQMDIWSIAFDGEKASGEPALVQKDAGRILPLGITENGDYVYGLRNGTSEVYTGSLSAKPEPAKPVARRYPGRNSHPRWSPDGRKLAFFSRRGTENFGQDQRVITIQTVASGEETDVAPKLAHLEDYRWSPDGSRLLVAGSDNKGRGGLWVVDPSTSRITPVVQNETYGFRGLAGDWAADGKAVYYSSDGVLHRKELAGSADAVIASHLPIHSLTVTSDGAELAGIGETAVLVFDLASGKLREVGPSVDAVRVQWLGRDLYLTRSGADGGLFKMGADGRFERVGPCGRQGDFHLHPDGKQFAFTQGETRDEVWVLPGAAKPEAARDPLTR